MAAIAKTKTTKKRVASRRKSVKAPAATKRSGTARRAVKSTRARKTTKARVAKPRARKASVKR